MTGVSSPYSANSYSGPMRRTGVSMADRVEPLEAFGIPRGLRDGVGRVRV